MPNTLVSLRTARGYSQAELARLAGISQTMLWKLEHRDHTPKGLKSALALAAVLRCKVLDIWPEAAPQRLPKLRPLKAAAAVAGVRRTTLKNQGKRKG